MCVKLYQWLIELEGIFVLPLAPHWVRHSYLSKKKARNAPPILVGYQTWFANEHLPSGNDSDDANDDHIDTQPGNNKESDDDTEIEPAVEPDNPPPKNTGYDKKDFIARNHGKDREP